MLHNTTDAMHAWLHLTVFVIELCVWHWISWKLTLLPVNHDDSSALVANHSTWPHLPSFKKNPRENGLEFPEVNKLNSKVLKKSTFRIPGIVIRLLMSSRFLMRWGRIWRAPLSTGIIDVLKKIYSFAKTWMLHCIKRKYSTKHLLDIKYPRNGLTRRKNSKSGFMPLPKNECYFYGIIDNKWIAETAFLVHQNIN